MYWRHELRFYDTHESCMHRDSLPASIIHPSSIHTNPISRQRSLSGGHWCSSRSGEPRQGMITSERESGYRKPGKMQQVGPDRKGKMEVDETASTERTDGLVESHERKTPQ